MSFFEELKRRKVFRVGASYAVVAFIIMQLVEIVFPIFNFPQWTSQFIIIVLLLGFPIAVILSWIFDKTPQGYIKTDAPDTENISGMNVKVDDRPFYLQKRNIFLALGVIGGILIGTYGGDSFKKSIDDKSIAVLPFDNFSKEYFDDTEKNTQSAIAMIKDPNFEPNMKKLQKQLVQTMRYMEAVLHRVVKFSYNQFLKEPKFQKYAPKEWGIVQAQTKSKQFADNEIKFANFTHAEEANWADWELPNDMGPDGSKVKLSSKQDASQGGELDPDTPDTPAPVATPATPYQEPENSD